MEDAELLRNASDDEVLYAATLVLSDMYSLGGVSMGRSVRSFMLSVIINCLFTRKRERPRHVDDLGLQHSGMFLLNLLLIEMPRRKPRGGGQLVLFDQYDLICDDRLAEMAAAILLDWYEKDCERPDPLSYVEYQFVQEIVKMISPPKMSIDDDLIHRVILMNEDRQSEARRYESGMGPRI